MFGNRINKLVSTKPNKPNLGIQGDRIMRVKRNGIIIK